MKHEKTEPVNVLEESGVTSVGAPINDAAVEEERASIARSGARIRRSNRTFTLILFALISLSLLIVMALGTSGYKSLVENRNSNGQTRLLCTLVTTTLHMNDEANAVSLGTGPEGPSLVMTERLSTGSYETRLYLYQGHIMQEYAVAGTAYNPSGAQALVETNTLSFEIKDSMVNITTDQGTSTIYLRSQQGSSASSSQGGA